MVSLPRADGAAVKKDLAEISTELDEYFVKEAGDGARVAALLKAPICELPDATNTLPGKFDCPLFRCGQHAGAAAPDYLQWRLPIPHLLRFSR
jgi:hypothetical protein